MMIKNTFKIMSMVFPCFFFGCSDKPTPSSVPGYYLGNYGGGVEVFEIRQDGTFTQTFTQNSRQLYTNTGRWHIDGTEVVFSPFIAAFDFSVIPIQFFPKHGDMHGGLWDSMYPRIVFSDEMNYWIIRQTSGSVSSGMASSNP